MNVLNISKRSWHVVIWQESERVTRNHDAWLRIMENQTMIHEEYFVIYLKLCVFSMNKLKHFIRLQQTLTLKLLYRQVTSLKY